MHTDEGILYQTAPTFLQARLNIVLNTYPHDSAIGNPKTVYYQFQQEIPYASGSN